MRRSVIERSGPQSACYRKPTSQNGLVLRTLACQDSFQTALGQQARNCLVPLQYVERPHGHRESGDQAGKTHGRMLPHQRCTLGRQLSRRIRLHERKPGAPRRAMASRARRLSLPRSKFHRPPRIERREPRVSATPLARHPLCTLALSRNSCCPPVGVFSLASLIRVLIAARAIPSGTAAMLTANTVINGSA